MTDKELLEYAAKAAGMMDHYFNDDLDCLYKKDGFRIEVDWNPLTDDGDALRLAVKLELQVRINDYDTMVGTRLPLHITCAEKHNNDPYAATRRAIVKAAAEIGKEQA